MLAIYQNVIVLTNKYQELSIVKNSILKSELPSVNTFTMENYTSHSFHEHSNYTNIVGYKISMKPRYSSAVCSN